MQSNQSNQSNLQSILQYNPNPQSIPPQHPQNIHPLQQQEMPSMQKPVQSVVSPMQPMMPSMPHPNPKPFPQPSLAGGSQDPPRNASFIRHFTQKCILLVSEELSKKETHDLLKTKVISPIINMLYVALFPYIMVTIVVIFIILLASLLTLVFFMLDHFRKRT